MKTKVNKDAAKGLIITVCTLITIIVIVAVVSYFNAY
jgi:hypothetical protein